MELLLYQNYDVILNLFFQFCRKIREEMLVKTNHAQVVQDVRYIPD